MVRSHVTSNKEGKKMGKRKEREIKWKRRRGKGKEGERWMCASWQSASNTTTTLPVLYSHMTKLPVECPALWASRSEPDLQEQPKYNVGSLAAMYNSSNWPQS